MRKIMVIAMSLLVISLTGCSEIELVPTTITKLNGELVEIQGDNMYSEWVDSVTGVHYFHTYRGGLTPRYNADGTLMTDK